MGIRLGGLLGAVAVATVAGSLVTMTPAHANDTTKTVAADGASIVFSTSDSSRKVSGNVTLTVHEDGNWRIAGGAHNGNIVGRWYHWTCDLTWDASKVTRETGSEWVPGKKDRSTSSAAYHPTIQSEYAKIKQYGRADCDIVIG
ncbi:hypothetical protein [Paractinoplanes hotanensis]|uniref:Uncharacterized protein n=1 Tax=Paractinoplanes hotanensis TaxID=2906497 RepID=A0ABT0Y700_9ACTN|nr:hypothetical protein [Actinoplanes hotanensis]MCM4081094.1 hypothetical protein [Actinoplanes hotanensis]